MARRNALATETTPVPHYRIEQWIRFEIVGAVLSQLTCITAECIMQPQRALPR